MSGYDALVIVLALGGIWLAYGLQTLYGIVAIIWMSVKCDKEREVL